MVKHEQAMDYLRQIKAFSTFSQLFETRGDQVKVDNAVFRLHSQCTVLILMVGTMFVSMRQYFGEPIECLSSRTDLPPNMLQHYCWLESTFSVSDSAHKNVGIDVAYPGVKLQNPNQGERKVYHKYYQWVYFVLIIQSIMFYVPKYMWKAKESRRLRNLITELRAKHIEEWSEFDRKRLVQDVSDTLLISGDYFFFFFFCETFYFIHLIVQIWFINVFLQGQFLRLGVEWLVYNHEQLDNKYDPLIRVFPRLTKCLFHKYGYSGSIESHDALCFLTLNIVNEKIYVVLWFWFVFLFIVTSICLLQRIGLVLLPWLRLKKLRQLAPSTDEQDLHRLTSTAGGWFIGHLLSNNMRPSYFRDLIKLVMKQHYDEDSKPKNSSKLTKAIKNGLHALSPSAPSAKDKPPSGKKGKSGGVNPMKNIGFKMNGNHQPKAGFVIVNRDPPSGVSQDSDEWNLNNMVGNKEKLLEEPWP